MLGVRFVVGEFLSFSFSFVLSLCASNAEQN